MQNLSAMEGDGVRGLECSQSLSCMRNHVNMKKLFQYQNIKLYTLSIYIIYMYKVLSGELLIKRNYLISVLNCRQNPTDGGIGKDFR